MPVTIWAATRAGSAPGRREEVDREDRERAEPIDTSRWVRIPAGMVVDLALEADDRPEGRRHHEPPRQLELDADEVGSHRVSLGPAASRCERLTRRARTSRGRSAGTVVEGHDQCQQQRQDEACSSDAPGQEPLRNTARPARSRG